LEVRKNWIWKRLEWKDWTFLWKGIRLDQAFIYMSRVDEVLGRMKKLDRKAETVILSTI